MTGPPLTPRLLEQARAVAPSEDGGLRRWPLRLALRSGRHLERVLGVEGDVPPGAPEVRWGDDPVVGVEESRLRLPAALATRAYSWGESGMGYVRFSIVLADGRVLPRVTGTIVDFPALPAGVTTADVADVLPGGSSFGARPPRAAETTAPFTWLRLDR